MLSMISEILSNLKFCLLMALFTGFLFGYLYTKLKSREWYYPDVKKFTNNIAHHTQKLKKIEINDKKVKSEIEHYKDKLKGTDESILKYKEQFESQKKLHMSMLTKSKEFKAKYEEKKNILDHYTREINKIKKECRLDDISNIEETKKRMDELIKNKSSDLKEKQKKFSMIQEKVKKLDRDNHKLEENLHELNKKSEDIALKIIEKTDVLKSLEKGFVKEYERLYKKISVSHDRVKEYKKKLRKLKEY